MGQSNNMMNSFAMPTATPASRRQPDSRRIATLRRSHERLTLGGASTPRAMATLVNNDSGRGLDGSNGGNHGSGPSAKQLFIQSLFGDVDRLVQQKKSIPESDPDYAEKIADIDARIRERVERAVTENRSWVSETLFQIWAPQYDDFMRVTGHEQALEKIIRGFVAAGFIGNGSDPISILDLSCGTCIPLKILLENLDVRTRGRVYVQANDISPDMAAIGKRRLDKLLGAGAVQRMIAWESKDIEQRSLRSLFGLDKIDIAILSQTIHLLSPEGGRNNAFSNMIDVVKPGGLVFVIDEFPPILSNGNVQALGGDATTREIVRHLFMGLAEVTTRSPIATATTFRGYIDTAFARLLFRSEAAEPIDDHHKMHGFVFEVNKTKGP